MILHNGLIVLEIFALCVRLVPRQVSGISFCVLVTRLKTFTSFQIEFLTFLSVAAVSALLLLLICNFLNL